MKLSRRGIIAGLLVAGAAPTAAVEHRVEPPKPTFIKGQIMPRSVVAPDPRFAAFGSQNVPAVVIYEYQIYDGETFVPLNSAAGQRVVEELSG